MSYCWKSAAPASVLLVMDCPAAVTFKEMRERLMAPIRAVEPVSLCRELASNPLGSVQAAPFATAIVVKLLTLSPVCTATGTWHPETPSGTTNWITSQPATPFGTDRLRPASPQQLPRDATTTDAPLRPTHTFAVPPCLSVTPLCVSS